MTSRTGCRTGILKRTNGVVRIDPRSSNREAPLQAREQLVKPGELGRDGLLKVKVPQDEKANIALVEPPGARVGPNPVKMPALPEPPGRIDNKVVANVIPAI